MGGGLTPCYCVITNADYHLPVDVTWRVQVITDKVNVPQQATPRISVLTTEMLDSSDHSVKSILILMLMSMLDLTY